MKKLILATLFVCSLFSVLERKAYSETYYGSIKFLGNIFYGQVYGDVLGTPPAYNVTGIITFAKKSIVPNLYGIIADNVSCKFDFNETGITGRYEEGKITATSTFYIAVEDSYKYSTKRDLIVNSLEVSCYGLVNTSIITFGVADIYIDEAKK